MCYLQFTVTIAVCVQLKEKVSEKFGLALERVCLIHTGKILDDAEDLIGRGIGDETVVHMVVKSAISEVCSRELHADGNPAVSLL